MSSIIDSAISSPDPLGMSDENVALIPSPPKARASSITPRRALAETSGNRTVQEFHISTPTKGSSKVGQSTQSPWRLRMTLEATPIESEKIAGGLKEKTIVTKIPLKGGDDSSPVDSNRGRGIQRKSLGSPIRRMGTPKPKANRRKTMPEPVEAADDPRIRETSPFAKPGDAFPKRRSRKSVSPSKKRGQSTPEIQTAPSSDAESKRKRSRSRKRRTEITPMKLPRDFEDSLDIPVQAPDSPCRRSPSQETAPEAMLDVNDNDMVPQLDEQTDFDDAVEMTMENTTQRERSNEQVVTRDPTEEHHDFDTILESEGFSMVSIESLSSTGNSLKSPTEQTGGIRLDLPVRQGDAIPTNTPSQHEIVHGYSDISSSIVSAASPTKTSHLAAPPLRNATPKSSPSILRNANDFQTTSSVPPVAPVGSRVFQLRRKPKQRVASSSPSLVTNTHGYSDISSLRSDEPPYLNRIQPAGLQKTPTNGPSPPVPDRPIAAQPTSASRPLDEASDGTPKLDRIKRVGSALQDLPSPARVSEQKSDQLGSPIRIEKLPAAHLSSQASNNRIVISEADAMASSTAGIEKAMRDVNERNRRRVVVDSKAQRERAKRRKMSDSPNQFNHGINERQFTSNQAANHAHFADSMAESGHESSKQGASQMEVIYPSLTNRQLPSPAESFLDDEDHSKNQIVGEEHQNPQNDDTMMAREAEWQREREAVSKQIQLANTSQVIVVDSDDSGISSESRSHNAFDGFTSELGTPHIKIEPQSQMSDLFLQSSKEHLLKNGLPNSWDQTHRSYDDEDSSKTNESDLFWQPDQKRTEAAKKRQERRRRARVSPRESSSSNGNTSKTSNHEETAEPPVPSDEGLTSSSVTKASGNQPSPARSRSVTEKNGFLSKELPPSLINISGNCSIHEETVLLDSFSKSSLAVEESNSYRSPDITLDSLNLTPKYAHNEPSRIFSNQYEADNETWTSSPQSLTLIDPELLRPTHTTTSTISSTDIATQISTLAPLPFTTTTTTTQPPKPTPTWLSTLTSLLTPSPPLPIPWYNSPHPTLPPATLSDILASSLSTAHLPPTFPWTPSHQHALLPLYHASWLFGAHIFAPTPTTTASFTGRIFTTPLGWARDIRPGDMGAADAFMALLAVRSRGYRRKERSSSDAATAAAAAAEEEQQGEEGHQYNRPAGTPIDTEFVLRKCVEAWVDLVMCGDIPHPPPAAGADDGASTSGGGGGGAVAVGVGRERIGLRRKGDRLWRAGSWWDLEWERSRKGYFERKRRGWGGLPSWRVKGLV